jgi:hypothetical protein
MSDSSSRSYSNPTLGMCPSATLRSSQLRHHLFQNSELSLLYILYFIYAMDHDFLMTDMVMKRAFQQNKNDMEVCSLRGSLYFLHSDRKKEVM